MGTQSWSCFFVSCAEEDYLDDTETREPPNVESEAAHVVILHPFENRLSRPHP
jgi:hypothetical protein